MTEYESIDPAIGEMHYQAACESRDESERLRGLPEDELLALVRNTRESTLTRANALLLLRQSPNIEMADILVEMLDDPDVNLRCSAIRSYRRCKSQRMRERLLALLDDPDDRIWSIAAVALSWDCDEEILPRVNEWLSHGTAPQRNVAIACLQNFETIGLETLQHWWDEHSGQNIEHQLAVANGLFSMGDARGLSTLEQAAIQANGLESVFSATAIYMNDRVHGLRLFAKILADGNLDAMQGMVYQISSLARLPHAFTADGIHEARLWVETEIDKLKMD